MLVNHVEISPRDGQVLKAVVENYIIENAPVGSTILKKKYKFSCSPATIRNSMSSLENKNLLMHTHTSSGRIPTDKGYRYYVDHLLQPQDNSLKQIVPLEDELTQSSKSVDDLLNSTVSMLSEISHLFGVAMILQYEKSILHEIELVRLSSDRVMLILGMKSGIIRSIVMNLNVEINDSSINNITQLLKEKLLGLTLEEIQGTINDRIKDSPLVEHEVIQILLRKPEENFVIPDDNVVYTPSNHELLDQPEYQELENLQNTLIAINEENVAHYFKTHLNSRNNYMFIGSENLETMYDQYTVTTQAFYGSSFQGQIGIIGPTRIPYAKIIQTLNQFKEIMNRVC